MGSHWGPRGHSDRHRRGRAPTPSATTLKHVPGRVVMVAPGKVRRCSQRATRGVQRPTHPGGATSRPTDFSMPRCQQERRLVVCGSSGEGPVTTPHTAAFNEERCWSTGDGLLQDRVLQGGTGTGTGTAAFGMTLRWLSLDRFSGAFPGGGRISMRAALRGMVRGLHTHAVRS